MYRKSLLALFFLAEISSLIYEICWVRQATLTFGVSIHAYMEEMLQAVYDNPAVLQDLGGPEDISRYWIMGTEQLREFAGPGDLVHDNDAFFLPISAETRDLIQIIQLAAVRANP